MIKRIDPPAMVAVTGSTLDVKGEAWPVAFPTLCPIPALLDGYPDPHLVAAYGDAGRVFSRMYTLFGARDGAMVVCAAIAELRARYSFGALLLIVEAGALTGTLAELRNESA